MLNFEQILLNYNYNKVKTYKKGSFAPLLFVRSIQSLNLNLKEILTNRI